MKTCSCCRKSKSRKEFANDPTHKDGLYSWCKLCVNQRVHERKLGISRPKTYNIVNRKPVNRIVNNQQQRLCSICKKWKAITEYNRATHRRKLGFEYRCRLCSSALVRKLTHRLKIEVLSAYGNRCACCNETNVNFLTIDHINNDGKAHRKIVSGSKLYSWLRRHNFPKDGFQILCWNCNMGKSNNNGICPHKQM